MAGQILPERANHTFFVTFSVLTKIRFLSYDFGSRYARKLLKGSNNVDFGLVSKKQETKKWSSLGWCPESGTLDQKSKNMHPHREPQTQNKCWTYTRRLAEPIEGLNISLAQSSDKLCPKTFEPLSGLFGTKTVKPTKDLASLPVCNEKRIFLVLGFRFFCEWSREVGFWQFWLMLPGLRAKCSAEVFRWSFHWETRLESKSFEPLIDLLTFLVQKLWSTINNLIH